MPPAEYPLRRTRKENRMRAVVFTSILAMLLAAAPLRAATPAQKCETGKNKVAGKYAYCR
jgi:hypothetical protein